MASHRPTDLRRWMVAGAMILALVLGACASDQDPGLVEPVDPGSNTTSNTLGRCPAGGPDASTTPAGCIGPDGQVLRP